MIERKRWKKMIKYDSRGKIKNFNNFQAIVQNHYHRPSCHDKRKVSNERPARNPFPLARIEPETRMEGGMALWDAKTLWRLYREGRGNERGARQKFQERRVLMNCLLHLPCATPWRWNYFRSICAPSARMARILERSWLCTSTHDYLSLSLSFSKRNLCLFSNAPLLFQKRRRLEKEGEENININYFGRDCVHMIKDVVVIVLYYCNIRRC